MRDLDVCSTQPWLLNCRYRRQEREALSGSSVTTEGTTPVQLVSIIRRIAGLAVVALLVALSAGSASASLLPDDGAWCDQYTGSQVFLPWADPANYTLAPGGNFENNKSRWTLIAASRDTSDNEPFNVGGANDHSSLQIDNGGMALSPAMCVGLGQPAARVFFKQTGGLPGAALQIDVLYDDAAGTTQSQTIGMLGVAQQWRLSPQLLTMANLLPTLDAASTAIAFRFTAIGGSFKVDDLYVDPWQRP